MLILFYELEENTTNVHNSIIMIFQVLHSVLQAMSVFPDSFPKLRYFPRLRHFCQYDSIIGRMAGVTGQ